MNSDTLVKLISAVVGVAGLTPVIRAWTHRDELETAITGQVISSGDLKFLLVVVQFKNNSLWKLWIREKGSALLLSSFVANEDSRAQAVSWRRLGAYPLFENHPRRWNERKQKREDKRNWGTIIRLVPREIIKDERLITLTSQVSDIEDGLISLASACVFFRVEVSVEYRKVQCRGAFRSRNARAFFRLKRRRLFRMVKRSGTLVNFRKSRELVKQTRTAAGASDERRRRLGLFYVVKTHGESTIVSLPPVS